MQSYLDILSSVKNNGIDRPDRTGVGTRSIFGAQQRFDLNDGFPILTTKRIYWPAVVHELLWFLSGSTNIAYLQKNKVRIWNEWADENGEIGPLYGAQWRSWPTPNGETIDQIARVIDGINNNPNSRRHIVSAWNVAYLPDESMAPHENAAEGRMALATCHALFQFYVADGKLSCLVYARSQDVFLGTPFNISSYALLTHMIAHVCGLDVGDFIWTAGDVHLYNNHFEQAEIQLARDPMALPKLYLNPDVKSIDDFTFEDISLEGYEHHPKITASIAV